MCVAFVCDEKHSRLTSVDERGHWLEHRWFDVRCVVPMEASQSASVSPPVERVEVLLFELAGQRFAMPLASVVELTRSCAVQALPKAPDFVLGLLNLRGQVVPVLDLRRRLSLPETELDPSDYFVVTRLATRSLVLRVDRVLSIEWLSPLPSSDAERLSGPLSCVSGIAAVESGVVLIYDLERFLSASEARALDEASLLVAGEAPANP